MHDPLVATPVPGDQAEPAVADLLAQLRGDAANYVRSETAYLRAVGGERISHARPGVYMIAAGFALAIGIVSAVPVGAMLVLTPLIGPIAALAAVLIGGLAIGAILLLVGARRIKAALKPPEAR